MNDIHTIEKERDDLSLHVDLCAQRYLILEKRLGILEVKFDKLSADIESSRKSMSTTIIAAAGTVVARLTSSIKNLGYSHHAAQVFAPKTPNKIKEPQPKQ